MLVKNCSDHSDLALSLSRFLRWQSILEMFCPFICPSHRGSDTEVVNTCLSTVLQFLPLNAGEIEKLKIDQCKVYLRKHGLRLTGNKATFIERIKEHIDVVNGGGEKKYPVSSFVWNCKGDACTEDVVLFEQMYMKCSILLPGALVLLLHAVQGLLQEEL
ncbi:PREDICTED: uncharacterized protein LOC109186187 isoform X2 [Ipomoea nil]|uniref:uncharacterized protein LOC109186187 isoform X2 n=1 Tax=Ipomoea nil TaxID=35883 RepID=UPI000900C281|nr:PREDICTED: uncharacterized protein LOC109186187 isoform X2 [Ipomoea nil]